MSSLPSDVAFGCVVEAVTAADGDENIFEGRTVVGLASFGPGSRCQPRQVYECDDNHT